MNYHIPFPRHVHMTASGISIFAALSLAIWEYYFFWGPDGGPLASGIFGPGRFGFNMAWLTLGYLSVQLLSIPFAMRSKAGQFIGVVDGMASVVPLGFTIVAIFGHSDLLNEPHKTEAAILLLFMTAIDLFGGYLFSIALSRRQMDVNAPLA